MPFTHRAIAFLPDTSCMIAAPHVNAEGKGREPEACQTRITIVIKESLKRFSCLSPV